MPEIGCQRLGARDWVPEIGCQRLGARDWVTIECGMFVMYCMQCRMSVSAVL